MVALGPGQTTGGYPDQYDFTATVTGLQPQTRHDYSVCGEGDDNVPTYTCSKAQSFTTSSYAAPQDFVVSFGSALVYQGKAISLRGVNFNNVSANGPWPIPDLSRANEHATEYQRVADWGANHVRFGISYYQWAKDPLTFFSQVDQHVAWARQSHMWMYLALFFGPGGVGNYGCYEGYSNTCAWWTDQTQRQQVQDMWVSIAQHYANNPTVLGYDLLNEPTPPQGDTTTWPGWAQSMHDAVTFVDPNHLIFMEQDTNHRTFDPSQGGDAISGSNVVYEDHFYAPIHYTTPAGNIAPVDCNTLQPITYPGAFCADWRGATAWDKSAIAESLAAGYDFGLDAQWAANAGHPFIVGEFGAMNVSPGYVQYYSDLEDIFAWHGWNWTEFSLREGPCPVTSCFGDYTGYTAGDISQPNWLLINVHRAHMAGMTQPDPATW
jgi:hypothetical protein